MYGYHILVTRVKNNYDYIHSLGSAFNPSKEDCIYKSLWAPTLLFCRKRYYQWSEQVLDFAGWLGSTSVHIDLQADKLDSTL